VVKHELEDMYNDVDESSAILWILAQASARSSSVWVDCRRTGEGPNEAFLFSFSPQADLAAGSCSWMWKSSSRVILRIGTVLERFMRAEGLGMGVLKRFLRAEGKTIGILERFLRAEGMTIGVSLSSLEWFDSEWLDSESMASIGGASIVDSTFAISEVFRWAGEGGMKDLLVDVQADRHVMSSTPPKRMDARCLLLPCLDWIILFVPGYRKWKLYSVSVRLKMAEGVLLYTDFVFDFFSLWGFFC